MCNKIQDWKDNDDHKECWLKWCEEMTRRNTGVFLRFVAAVAVQYLLSLLAVGIWVGFESQTFRVSNLEWHVPQGWILNFQISQYQMQREKIPLWLFLCQRRLETSFFAAAAPPHCHTAAAVPCFHSPSSAGVLANQGQASQTSTSVLAFTNLLTSLKNPVISTICAMGPWD